MIEKARTLGAPAVIVDLEDGVGAAEKAAARESLAGALDGWPERPLLFVRVNGPETDLFVDDLRENCEGAEAVGMTSILHRGPDQTLPRLEELLGVELR